VNLTELCDVVSPSRVKDIGRKGWRYILEALEHPAEIPHLLKCAARGVHIGEFQKMKRRWLQKCGISTVIDVGANSGQFSSAIRALLPQATIYAFEPLPECAARLTQRIARLSGSGVTHVFQVAVGDREGEVEFWRSSFTKASSALPMAELHRKAFPWSRNANRLSVPMVTLDSLVARLALLPKVLLKIDVQGYERHVLEGAREFLRQVDVALVEVSFQELYQDQACFDDIYLILKDQGFFYLGNLEQCELPDDGSILQADALFIRAT
jgi:FkbM family methyltransferase